MENFAPSKIGKSHTVRVQEVTTEVEQMASTKKKHRTNVRFDEIVKRQVKAKAR